MSLVFQYGSNTSLERLNSEKRLQGSAISLCLACTRDCFELVFTYYSACNDCATADLAPGKGRRIYGVLYDIPDDRIYRSPSGSQHTLDYTEGEGSAYRRTTIPVIPIKAELPPCQAITYLVIDPIQGLKTDITYVRHIIKGLREHDAPIDYINYVKERVARNNPELVTALVDL